MPFPAEILRNRPTAPDLVGYNGLEWKAYLSGLLHGLNRYPFRNVQTMVNGAIAASNGRKVGRFMILDHGAGGGEPTVTTRTNPRTGRTRSFDNGTAYLQIGEEGIGLADFGEHEAKLRKLATIFDKKSRVVLHNCYAGADRKLMLRLADTFKVPVTAATRQVGVFTDLAWGDNWLPDARLVTAYPGGKFEMSGPGIAVVN